MPRWRMPCAGRLPGGPATLAFRQSRRCSGVASKLTSVDLTRDEVGGDVLDLPVGVLGQHAQPLERHVRRVAVLGYQDPLGLLDDGARFQGDAEVVDQLLQLRYSVAFRSATPP